MHVGLRSSVCVVCRRTSPPSDWAARLLRSTWRMCWSCSARSTRPGTPSPQPYKTPGTIVRQPNRIRFLEFTVRRCIERSGLPTYHLRVRHAVVLPRVLPSSKEEFIALRNAVDDRLSALLSGQTGAKPCRTWTTPTVRPALTCLNLFMIVRSGWRAGGAGGGGQQPAAFLRIQHRVPLPLPRVRFLHRAQDQAAQVRVSRS